MARSVASLAVSVTANTRKFSRGMQRARKQTKQFTLDVKGMGAALRGMGAGALLSPITAIGTGIAAAGAAFVKAARAAEDFNRAMRNSQAIMGDLSHAINTDMRKAAFDVARFTQFSATEAAKSYFFLASAGLDATQSIKAMPVVSKFAQAGMFDLAQATDLLTDAQSALGMTVDDSARNMQNMLTVSDVLVRANTLANASVEQFSQALTNKAGAALKIVGKDIEEGVAVLAAFADQGLKGAEAGTALNIVMRDMQTKALQNKHAFAAMNVSVFDSVGEMRNMADIIGDVERALTGMSDATKKQTLLNLGFTDKSVIFIQTLLGLSEGIRDYESALRSAAGATAEVAEKQLTSFQKGWAELSGTARGGLQWLQAIPDAVGGVMDAYAKFLRAFWIDVPRGAWDIVKRSGTVVAEELMQFTDALADVASPRLSELNSELRESLMVGERLEQELADRVQRTKELADATNDVATATKRTVDRGQWKEVADIIGGLSDDLGHFGKTWGELSLERLGELGASPNAMRLARDTVEALESQRAAKELDDIIYGLEREQQALTHTARELDLLEAGWKGASQEQLAYINNLHDSIDATREQAKLDRQAKTDAARHAKAADRITRFMEIDVSRTLISGLAATRGKKQKVQDDDAFRELQQINRNTQRNAYALVGP